MASFGHCFIERLYILELHRSIPQTLVNSLKVRLNFEIGGLDWRVIRTEFISRVIE